MTVIISRWMEAYPEKLTIHCIMRVEHVVMCTIHFIRGKPPSTEKLLQLLLII